jgi:predicted MFS family arabinose efflux permease
MSSLQVLTPVGMLQPLRNLAFRQLWLANFAANLGKAVQSYGVLWLMVSASHTALSGALVQAVSSGAMLAFAVLAGLLADAVDRVRLQFWIHTAMASVSVAAAVLVSLGLFGRTNLLVLTFVSATGAALLWPAWQAHVVTTVPSRELPATASLNNLSFHAAALLGPCVGAALSAATGVFALFLIHAGSCMGLLHLYRKWPKAHALPGHGSSQRHAQASSPGVGGVVLILKTPAFRHLLLLAAAVFYSAAALSALLPSLARSTSQLTETALAALMGALGFGAMVSAVALPWARSRFRHGTLLAMAMLALALALAMLPHAAGFGLGLLTALGGFAWAVIITTFNASMQLYFADALRARALSLYMLAMGLGQTLGSISWGWTADQTSLALAYSGASAALAACALYTARAGRGLLDPSNRP